ARRAAQGDRGGAAEAEETGAEPPGGGRPLDYPAHLTLTSTLTLTWTATATATWPWTNHRGVRSRPRSRRRRRLRSRPRRRQRQHKPGGGRSAGRNRADRAPRLFRIHRKPPALATGRLLPTRRPSSQPPSHLALREQRARAR